MRVSLAKDKMNITNLFQKDRILSIVGRASYGQLRTAHEFNKFNISVTLNIWFLFYIFDFDPIQEQMMFR